MGYVLGVDFGTSFTAAVAYSAGASRVVTLGKRAGAVPTASFVREDGSLIHGEDAYLVGVHDPDRLIRNLKRRLADDAPIMVAGRSYTPIALTSAYLRWVVDAASLSEGGPPDHLLFTHPANWRSSRQENFRQALIGAGLHDVEFASEPFAAAAFHAVGGQVAVGDLVGVYDLGGGTFDAAVLRRTAEGFVLNGEPEGIEHLGGVDFDDVLFHLVRSRVGEPWINAERKGGPSFAVAVAGIRRECTAAKEALSVDTEVEIPVMLPGVNQVVKVTRLDFERLIAPSVADTIGAFRRSLRQAGVSPADLSAVLLVGGSVALNEVRNAVRQVVGDVTPVLDADPKYAVARGAALLAAHALPGATATPTAAPSAAPVVPAAPATGSATAPPPPPGAGGPTGMAPPSGPIGMAPPSGPATVLAPNLAAAPSAPPAPPSGAGSAPPAAMPPAAAAPPAHPIPAGNPSPGAPPPPAAGAPGAGPVGGPAAVPVGGSPQAGPPATAGGSFVPQPPERKRSNAMVVLVGLVVVAVLGAAVAFVALRGDGTDVATDGGGTDTATTDGGTGGDGGDGGEGGGDGEDPAPTGPASADRMSEVSGGKYTVGLDPQGAESAKARPVELDTFYIDEFEVTNGEYDTFVQQIGAPPATVWPGGRLPDDLADHPVTGVEWAWAQAYCRALDKRLPTEAEWEAAARGPGALLYPWGAAREAVDIDTAGSRPVGSTVGNVSVFGVHDTVASVWEWVDEPYEPVEPGRQVRHGGQNGRVRDGAAMRQVVDPANKSVIAETGFRCAADEVDDSVEPGVLNPEIDRPATTTTVPRPVNTGSGPGTVLVDDNFEERTSGFREAGDAKYSIGYYAPSWYHVEAKVPAAQVMTVGGYSYADASFETHAHVDGTRTGNGRVRYGLAVRAGGELREPAPAAGPARPSSFVAFTIDPRAGRWEVLQAGAAPLTVLQSGALPAGVNGFSQANPDAIKLEMKGTTLTGYVNGTKVVTVDVPGIEAKGDLGFYAETIDETYADVHFADLKVVAL